ncbi:putative WD domain, G-beta repeat [Leishmania naiffi]|uniref:WD domain, G-beta repeat n=1 Tax=Leishmania naiffi TaxID=5678 RepID=A0AAW3C576_9TRYP
MSRALTPYRELQLPHPPALLYNNLQLHQSGTYVSYAADSAVYTIRPSTGALCFSPLRFPGGHVHHLASLQDDAEQNIILIIVLSTRVAVIAVNGQQTHMLPVKDDHATLTCAAVVRVAGKNEMVVAVGSSDGIPLCSRYTLQGQPVPSVELTMPVQAHARRSITALDLEALGETSQVEMASGDSGGHVVLWADNNPTLMIPPESDTDAVTCLRLVAVRNAVAVAYGGGQIRLIQCSSGAVIINIQAHSRWINAMVYSAAQHWLVSGAEDGQLSVWDVTSANPTSVCLASGDLRNELPTGLAFLGDQGALLVASYDVAKLRFFSTPCKGR